MVWELRRLANFIKNQETIPSDEKLAKEIKIKNDIKPILSDIFTNIAIGKSAGMSNYELQYKGYDGVSDMDYSLSYSGYDNAFSLSIIDVDKPVLRASIPVKALNKPVMNMYDNINIKVSDDILKDKSVSSGSIDSILDCIDNICDRLESALNWANEDINNRIYDKLVVLSADLMKKQQQEAENAWYDFEK